ncbi:hypothetical protein PROPHIGD91-2_42 [Mycobacterium phage prophiGD91-2]|uniref:hypothetical protein n=1 Tax=Mycobacteroides abscessus TaxID=36809 RepID=UPI000928091E|nr:hypothetical protein [Mycobacteroides abscessus]QSM03897.1 hypothetical protein PROPHIGD91-2_42 [Mycobacterium phage prophiGD91-2]QSM90505.1 hypothetical protein I3U44_07495 [Mycobacteroides abscessus subsp. bolletii]QSM90791.1 hypothetical protein I3U44_09140 [Mycobacteroides abscessus subsp. bolletii]SIJ02050.1 Bacteriophage protein [Mycobacteroides abscessus subsp. bolletii]SLD37244.1 Bacteriophage protein [Mycobacteroides abscessus subsp. bolletii]
MSELVDRAKASLEGVDPYSPWEVDVFSDGTWAVYAADSLKATSTDYRIAKFIAAARQLVPELIAVIEFLEPEVAHWKALWKGTVEYSTKVIQERDEALREVERLTAGTKRVYTVGYINGLGTVSTFGAENSWLPAVVETVAEVSRDDPGNEFFVAYRDIPQWKRLPDE